MTASPAPGTASGAHGQKKNTRVRVTEPLFATLVVNHESFGMEKIAGHGELFLIATVLTGDAPGRIWRAEATHDVIRRSGVPSELQGPGRD